MHNQQKLFDDSPFTIFQKESIQLENHLSQKAANKARNRKFSFQHIDKTYSLPKTGIYDFPIVKPYRGLIPTDFTPYDHHKTGNTLGAVHFFIDDYNYPCMHIWSNLQNYTHNVSRYNVIIAPDNSMYLDQSAALNIYQVYQNRVITAYWQKIGLNVIPVVSWGNADSFNYCFDALPQNSILAIGGLGTKCSKALTTLWEYGVKLTIEKLQPQALILYGSPTKYDLQIETHYIEDYIHAKFPKH